MHIHYHSAYVGLIVFVLLSLLGVQVIVAIPCLLLTALTDVETFRDRVKARDQPWWYACVSLAQGALFALLYLLLRNSFWE